MRRWIPLLFVALATLLALRPLWDACPVFLFTADGFAHLFRFYDFDAAIHHGIFYPRWSFNSAYGYAYPLFNFYSPLAYYVAETFHGLGATIPQSILATLALTVPLALTGAYALGALFSDDQTKTPAGTLVATAYVFFPYFLLDIYSRGALGEAFAAAILPWFVWAWRRVLTLETLSALVTAGMLSAILVLSHNLIAFMAMPLVAVYTLWELARLPQPRRVRAVKCAGASVFLGALLGAIYWLPTLAELQFITGSRNTPRLIEIIQSSVFPLTQVIQPSLLYQYGDDPYPLPLVPLGLSVCAFLLAVISVRRKHYGTVVFFFIATLVETSLVIDWMRGIWLQFPFSAAQFPWRISVFIGLTVALTIGQLPQLISTGWRRIKVSILAALLVAVLMGVGLSNLAPQVMDYPHGELTIGQMARYEVNSRAFGFVWLNEYMPLSVKALPAQLNQLRNDAPIPTIHLSDADPIHWALDISTEQSAPIVLRSFYFPDWQSTIDGQPAPVYPSTPMGLATVDVPSGNHRVVFTVGDTLPRRIGTWLSIAGLIFFAGWVSITIRRNEPGWRVNVIIALSFLVIAAPVVGSALMRQSSMLEPKQIDVSSAWRLIGFTVDGAKRDATTWHIDDARSTVRVQVHWQVKQSSKEEPVAWRLVDSAGRAWSTQEMLPRYGTGFAGAWVPNEIVLDEYTLALDPGMPIGRYDVQMRAGDASSFVSITPLQLNQPRLPVNEPVITQRINARLGDRIRLLAYTAPANANRSQVVPLVLYWQAERNIFEELTVFAHLINSDGNLVAQQDSLPQDGFYPTMLWSPFEIVSDKRNVKLPSSLTPGLYRWSVGMYRAENLEHLAVTSATGEIADDAIEIGEIKIPMNVSSKPSHAVEISLGTDIRLIGFDLSASDVRGTIVASADNAAPPRLVARNGHTLALALYWQAGAHIAVDYKVFVHFIDDQGNIVAQRDALPGNGTYPTRIWDEGELMLDPYAIKLEAPPGNYRLVAGMYDVQTGERLAVTDPRGQALLDRQIEIAQVELSER